MEENTPKTIALFKAINSLKPEEALKLRGVLDGMHTIADETVKGLKVQHYYTGPKEPGE